MKFKPLPSLEYLQKLFDYCPISGDIIRKIKKSKANIGDKFGCLNKLGYLVGSIDGVRYSLHRIAFYMGTKVDPMDKQIDHINKKRNDNRLENLRLATNAENNWNKNTTSGVHFDKDIKKWRVRVRINGFVHNGGSFENKNDALKKRNEMKLLLCNGFYKEGVS